MEPENVKKPEIIHRQFDVSLCEQDFKKMCGRYHFGDTGLPHLKKVYRDLGDTEVSLYIHLKDNKTGKTAVLLSLGNGMDRLQNRYMAQGKMSEAYMLECLAMELLSIAYRKADEIIFKICGMWCGRYEFPGGEIPLEWMAEIVDGFGQTEVTYNSAFALIPKKSVVYITKLQKEKPDTENSDRKKALCAGCENINCSNRENYEPRKLNYGYQRIFGKEKEK